MDSIDQESRQAKPSQKFQCELVAGITTYAISALPGMSCGPVLDSRGNLVGINGRATVDLRTGTVNSVLGIDIDRYLRIKSDLASQK